jgi:magnesium transporter
VRIFHVGAEQFSELPALPDALPNQGFVWIGATRTEFEADLPALQERLQRWEGGSLVDLHVSDLLNRQLPSHYDYTSWYDMLVFRRLAAASATRCSTTCWSRSIRRTARYASFLRSDWPSWRPHPRRA